jgi:hypothetical protein
VGSQIVLTTNDGVRLEGYKTISLNNGANYFHKHVRSFA